jgi:DNA-binding IclR family transcriptional regulator
VDKLLDLIRQARERGYAFSVEEYFIGDLAVAAPVVDASGYPLGAVNIAVPTSRGSSETICKELAPHVIAAARAISNAVRNIRMVNLGMPDTQTK